MALTRIKNNQLTDATIVASAKLVDNSISAGKLANDLNYGSNLTITGNLTVNGSSTTLDTVNTIIEDPILLLGKDQTGVAAYDLGFVGERGDSNNAVFVWKESADEFQFGTTTGTGDGTTVTLAGFADMQAAGITGTTLSLSGNITGPLNVTGAIEASTSITAGTTVTATGNVAGGNITTGGRVDATGTIEGGTLTDGTASINAGAITGATSGTFSTTLTATGNVAGGNITTAGQVKADNVDSTNAIVGGTTITATGNVVGGNVTTAGQVAADNADITNGITAGTTIVATGNITGGNLTTGGDVTTVTVTASGAIAGSTTITATGNITGGNLVTGGQLAADNVAATNGITAGTTIAATGNVSGGNLTTAGAMDSATINTTGEATLASAIVSDLTSGRVVLAGTSGAVEDSANMTFDGSTLGVTGAITASTTITATGNVAGGNITTGGAMEATGLITSGSTISATGNVSGGNLTTGGDIDATGDIAGGSVTTNVFRGSLPVISSTGTNADISINPNGTGSIDVNSAKITSLATPTADGDAANKAYVDSIAEGLDIKASCHAATTGVLPAVTYANGTDGVGATLTADANGAFAAVDGVTFTINERLLVKNQAAALQNGIYQLSTVGDAGTPFVLTRTTDFDNGTPSGEVPGAFTFIEEGTVNEDNGFVCTTNSPVTIGTTAINWVQFSGAGAITAGAGLSKTGDILNVEVDDVTTAIVSDEVTVKVSANLTTPNIGVANGDSFTASGIVTATGNVTGGNLTTGGDVTTVTVTASGAIAGSTTITATGNVAGGNLTTAAAMDSATINTTGEATLASAIVSDLTSGRVVLAGTAGAIEDNGNFTFDGSTAAVTGAITASTTITATGNVAGGNVTTGGAVEATGLISSGLTITATGNVAGGNITTGGAVEATGLISSGSTITATGNITGGNLVTGGQLAADNVAATNGITAGTTIAATGNVSGGNVTTAGQVQADNVDATNAIVGGTTITATGNVAGGNLTTGGDVTAVTVTASGAIAGSTTITATGNVAGGNITTGGAVDATGAVTGASLATGNITIGTDDIDSIGEKITINQASNDVDFIVEGNGDASLLVLDAGSDTVNIGTATVTTGAKLKVSSTDSILIPVGTTAQRPTAATGMIRFNTTLDSFEFYDSNSWTTAGADFTVIASETFNGDNSTVAFTLSTSQTTASCIVSINGVVQLPTTAYAVSTTTLTFTEAPLAGDVIEVREITTTSSITFISNATTSASIEALDGVATVQVVGDVLPKVNNTQDLGSASKLWAEVRATTYYGDGSNLTGLAAGTNVTNGTSNLTVASNADLTLTRGGTLTATVGTAGITMNNGAFVGALTGNADTCTTASGVAANSVALTTDTTGNYVAAGAVAGTGLTGGASGEGATFTVTSNATSANTANAIVARDGSGDFTAGVATLTATAARYADLAEKYASDGDIEAGTVVHFAGEGKVAECDIANCRSVAGIVSTDPAYLMNSDADGVALAIAGRVPTKVTGVVNAGDLIVSAGNGRGMANNDAAIGTVIGKAIEANEGGDGVIEVLALMM